MSRQAHPARNVPVRIAHGLLAGAFGCVVVALVALSAPHAPAQSLPARPAKLVVPFTPGGPLGATGRAIAQKLTLQSQPSEERR